MPIVPDALAPSAVIGPGDGLLYQGPLLRPARFFRGDIVVYRIDRRWGDHWYVPEGLGIDRVVGVPGDMIAVRDGVLTVNGGPPAPGEGPLGQVPRLGGFDLALEEGRYAIIPSLVLHLDQRSARAVLGQVCTVEAGSILGKVVFRLRPWSRFGAIRRGAG